MPLTRALAEFVAQTGFDGIPSPAIARAKQHILDGLGCALAGSLDPATVILRGHVKEYGGRPQAVLIGTAGRGSIVDAALVNGVATHVLDYDDVDWVLSGHPTAVLLPTILALGEHVRASGKDLLAAYILGFEVLCRVGRAVNPSHYQIGWHATATLGCLGAAGAAGKLLGMTGAELEMAFGLTASHSSGLRENFGTMTKSYHAGKAARDGMASALLVKGGFTAAPRILEASWGFCRVLARESNPELAEKGLGDSFAVDSPGASIKPYPSCAGTHPAIDAMLALAEENDLKPAEVDEIDCATDRQALDMLIYPEASTGLQGKFSMHYCLASALHRREVGLRQFTDEAVGDPRIQKTMRKVVLRAASEFDAGYINKCPAVVTVRTTSGRVYARQEMLPKGDPEKPLADDELRRKYEMCAGFILPEARVQALRDAILHLEVLDDTRELTELLQP